MSPEQLLSKYDDLTITLASVLRAFILQELNGIIEITDPAAKLIAYGYGPGYKDMICTILLSKKGVKLGFYKGSELPDPDRLLKGTGKVHRYLEVRSVGDFKDPAVKNLLKQAFKAYENRKTKQ